mgnify:CR=1 FL=1
MAEQRGETAAGCALAIVVLSLVFWPVVLTVLGVVVALGLVVWLASAHRFGQLNTICETAQRRFGGDVCLVDGRYGVVSQIELQGDAAQPKLAVVLDLIHDGADGAYLKTNAKRLSPPAALGGLRTNAGVSRFLEANGIVMVGDLAVEAKATRAALECLREVAWAHDALDKIQELRGSAEATLAKAEGNELLEPAIPQLQEALSAFEGEERKLQEALNDSRTLLRKLHDFLGVPEGIRPILTFDLDSLYDPQRLTDLEQSFEEVVLLNDAFRDLSRDRLI